MILTLILIEIYKTAFILKKNNINIYILLGDNLNDKHINIIK